MTDSIKAIGALRPRIEQGITVNKPEFLYYAARATGLVEGTLDQSIKEMRDQMIGFMRAGRAVKLDGLGTWAPSINLKGLFDVQYRPDTSLIKPLNIPGAFIGRIINRENIGLTADQLVALWNELHPEDPITTA